MRRSEVPSAPLVQHHSDGRRRESTYYHLPKPFVFSCSGPVLLGPVSKEFGLLVQIPVRTDGCCFDTALGAFGAGVAKQGVAHLALDHLFHRPITIDDLTDVAYSDHGAKI